MLTSSFRKDKNRTGPFILIADSNSSATKEKSPGSIKKTESGFNYGYTKYIQKYD